MTITHISSAPHQAPSGGDVVATALRLVSRLEFVGLAQRSTNPFSADPTSVRNALDVLAAHGVARDAVALVAQDSSVAAYRDAVARADDALQHSPLPASTWPVLLEVLGEDLLGELLSVSASSIHRYASGERSTPDDVMFRLHALALVVADVAGAYTDPGVRRWFRRPRVQLGKVSPVDLLRGGFEPEGKEIAAVSRLAAQLTAPLAT